VPDSSRASDAASRQRAITDLVSRTYEDPRVVARYVEIGLWLAEELLILEHLKDADRVLDLGCGAGRTTIPLAEMGFSVTGIDLSPVMIAVAQQQAEISGVHVQLQSMDARDLAFEDSSFDAALFSYNGFELVPGRQGKMRALAEIYRVLRPGGILVFCTHSLYALNSFAPARLANLLRVAVSRALGLPAKARELGERFIDDPSEEVRYIQILPPSAWVRMLVRMQFEVVYFNTRKRVERQRRWRWPAVWEDGERFYVARK
jgi:ubiquinone/menaquinone biosynthesis C-methylase UbiE